MAEIKVEKKTPVWPWILAAIIIGVLLYFLFFRDKEAENEAIEEVDEHTMLDIRETQDASAAPFAFITPKEVA